MKKIAEMMSLELSYQVDRYLSGNRLSPSGFASQCGVSEKAVQRLLSGKEVSTRDMERICDLLLRRPQEPTGG